jgi:hypothetical protein
MKGRLVEPPAPSRRRFSHPIVIALTALLLLAGVLGLVAWLFSDPTVYRLPISDPHWSLYPESDSLPEQEKLAFDGNVKVLSLMQTFQLSRDDNYLTDPQSEQFRKAYCHVLIDLPPEAVLRHMGSGWSTTSGVADTGVEVFIPEKGNVAVTKLSLSFRDLGLTERAEPYPPPSLSIRTIPYVYGLVDGTRIQVDPKEDVSFQVTTEPGEVIVVRIEDDGRINGEPIRIAERATGQLDAVDVERLLRKAKPD